MIAFGCPISEPEPYLRYADPGIRCAAEPDSEVFAFAAVGTIGRSYNLLLDKAALIEDLEALVLVHPYAEIVDPDLCAKVRAALGDPNVGVLGSIGATDVRTIAWWEGSVRSAPIIHRYQEHNGGDLRAFSWTDAQPPPGQVDMVDGWLLVLSPWTVRNVRFDESLTLSHGFDLDFCLQVRAAGRKVMVEDIRVIHHHDLELVSDLALWVEAHVRMAEKWDGQMPGVTASANGDWRARARRAEAEREAARAMANSNRYGFDARVLPLANELDQISHSISWRITEPLRRLNLRRRTRIEAARAGRGQRSTPPGRGGSRPEL